MIVRLCRTLHRLPDEIRSLEAIDFQMLIENVFEIPYIDEAFYRGFCGGGSKKSDKIAKPDTSLVRKATIEKILKDKEAIVSD